MSLVCLTCKNYCILLYVMNLFHHITKIMRSFPSPLKILTAQTKLLNLLTVDISALHRIDSGSIHTCVTKNVCQPHYVLLKIVVSAREKMTEIVWKNLRFRHTRLFAKLFHVIPYIRPVQWISISRYKNRAVFYFMIISISNVYNIIVNLDFYSLV